MKKILIFSHAMELGGAEMALLGLLENIDTSDYEVDLFLMGHKGELFKYIPNSINTLPEIPQYASLAVPIKTVLKKGQFAIAFGRLLGKRAAKKKKKELGIRGANDLGLQCSHLYTLPYMPRIGSKEYDLAISFLTPHYFVAEKVSAKRKVAWIHTDYSRVTVDQAEQIKVWSKYDYIASISEQVTNSFLMVFPLLEKRIVEIQNMIPMDYLDERKNAFNVKKEMPDDGSIKLLSVGRFCNAKNFDNIPDICKRIRENSLDVKWYLIGFGTDEPLIKQRIIDNNMQDYVIILGKKENPYPYIKECDLYVQPSRYEGKCVSVIEAQILQKPVVITDYNTSSSQLEDGVDGIIVPMENEKCAAGIVSVLNNSQTIEILKANCAARDYSNKNEIEKLYRLV